MRVNWIDFHSGPCPVSLRLSRIWLNTLEINVVANRIKDLEGRAEALRGYL
jgi:hypothetical protein